jgi:hypothetical protein
LKLDLLSVVAAGQVGAEVVAHFGFDVLSVIGTAVGSMEREASLCCREEFKLFVSCPGERE